MEPLTDYHGIEAATRAAQETGRSATDRPPSAREAHGIRALSVKPINFVRETVVPWCYAAREATKKEFGKSFGVTSRSTARCELLL